ncbi:hypothetical protein G4465_13895 [[Ruminococcus] gnavus]|uniref:hypothetical protein n=1 Tax=Mediterraneibacter gnavus TaxID=33038 RepID=UPI00156D6569|nr:hypothetical protein [Mediterraneibacter gnavus]NSD12558.1 hypothetical protein [Mediterraneibacter gnavus]
MADQKVREMEPVETQIVEIMPPDIENLIYVVRNKQVINLIEDAGIVRDILQRVELETEE